MQSKTPIVIITGYLGAGKTTFLRKIISSMKKKFAILMNEFGEIGIDGKILAGKNVKISELSGGCVCCSLTGELTEAIKEIQKKYAPEIIFIETTGVAEPDSIVGALEGLGEKMKIDSVITIADADALSRFPSLGHTGRVQIEMADAILLNKVDLVGVQQVEELEKNLRELNPRAEIFRTARCEVDTNLLFNTYSGNKKIEKHKTAEHITENYFSYTTNKKLSSEKFQQLAHNLDSEIFRAKGFLKTDEGNKLWNFVAGRNEFENFKTTKTELVFIGQKANAVKEKILKQLKECEMK